VGWRERGQSTQEYGRKLGRSVEVKSNMEDEGVRKTRKQTGKGVYGVLSGGG